MTLRVQPVGTEFTLSDPHARPIPGEPPHWARAGEIYAPISVRINSVAVALLTPGLRRAAPLHLDVTVTATPSCAQPGPWDVTAEAAVALHAGLLRAADAHTPLLTTDVTPGWYWLRVQGRYDEPANAQAFSVTLWPVTSQSLYHLPAPPWRPS